MNNRVLGGHKTAKTNKKRYGDDYYQKIGSMGGKKHSGEKQRETMLAKYGEDYFSRIGRKGGRKRVRNGNKAT